MTAEIVNLHGRTPPMKTLDQIAELARAYFAAKDAHYKAHCEGPKTFDYDNEEHIRHKIKSDRLCSVVVSAGEAYRAACDEFFRHGCPDLIQLLVDVDEYFDGQEDINGNGGPNMAMRCRSEIEKFLGPVPPKVEPEANHPFSGSF